MILRLPVVADAKLTVGKTDQSTTTTRNTFPQYRAVNNRHTL